MRCCKVRVEEGKQGGEGPKGKGQPAEGFKRARKQLGKGSQHQEGGALWGDEHKLGACDPDNADLTRMQSWYVEAYGRRFLSYFRGFNMQ